MSAPSATWRDRKRHLWLLALVMPVLPFAAVALNHATGASAWLWLGPIVILGVVPLVDLVVGRDAGSPPDEVLTALEQDRYYRWLTFAFLPIQYAGFALGLWYLASAGLSVADRVGLAVTIGFIGGLGINTAHELGHKRESHERWLSRVALAQSGYGHFYVEHNRGHHVRVATAEDPASSRLGESFYRFLPRTIAGSVRSAWGLERDRLSRSGRRPWRPANDAVGAWLMTIGLWAVMVAWLGWGIAPYLIIQAAIAIALLEAVNYLEHYGMLRRPVGRTSSGQVRYERVDPSHSWNSNNVATNVLLYHLQRHSDHHANPIRRYQALRDSPESPVLPTGYAGMILLALAPPLWRRVMDPLVVAHVGGDIDRANVHPPARARLARRFPRADVSVARDSPQAAPPTAAPCGPVVATCPGCGYRYDERVGDRREGFVPGTPWAAVPDGWCCPDCGVRDKADFELTPAA